MKKTFLFFLLLFLVSYVIAHAFSVHAEYVLPYPSYMPGNKLYRFSRIIDSLKNFWYFGNISQVKYHLGLSDKYLVEAKTLFEYQQYLLGADALTRSTKQYCQIPQFIKESEKENKDMSTIIDIVLAGGDEHIRILQNMRNSLPQEFSWTPEKGVKTDIALEILIEESEVCIRAVRESIQ